MRHITSARRTALVGAAVAAAVLLVSACGSDTTTSPPAEQPSSSPSASPSPTEEPTKEPAPMPEPGKLPATIPIDSAKPLGDGRTLTISYYIGPAACHGVLGTAKVEQDASGVTVTLQRKLPKQQTEAVACIQIVELKTTEVTLAAPLGSRTLTDGSTDKPITLAR